MSSINSSNFNPSLQQILQGRQLLLDEIPFSREEIEQHFQNGYVSFHDGLVKESGCQRCGNNEQTFLASFQCARCNKHCMYCRKCITMGRVSECTKLVSWTGPIKKYYVHESILTWDGKLSKGQQIASGGVIETVKKNGQLLIWAVCGAGKTEVLFKGIEEAIKLQKTVCIATPRTDVVLELAPRIKKAFPNVETIGLYGGSEDLMKNAPITIATTHQLLRFYRAFDVMIIDEVDAFPYSTEPMLQYAVDQAKKENAATVYLTATPNQKWQQEVIAGKRHAITIPARFHKNPLPAPEFSWCGNWRKKLTKNKLPTNVLNWIKQQLQNKRQAFLFVPNVDCLDKVVHLLREIHPNIDGVHSEDPNRKEKVDDFRQGDIPILVTTTILERGVTVPNINVAVLGAEDSIFTESALVQISGRVGRSAEYPTGEILFFHYGRTREMIRAKRQIEKMNLEAKNKGLLT